MFSFCNFNVFIIFKNLKVTNFMILVALGSVLFIIILICFENK